MPPVIEVNDGPHAIGAGNRFREPTRNGLESFVLYINGMMYHRFRCKQGSPFTIFHGK